MLLVESHMARRAELTERLRESGFRVVSVARIADVARWPVGDVVVTEFARFTTLWKTVGAAHVVVLADSASEGADACRRGATAWLPRGCASEALGRLLRTLDADGHASAPGVSRQPTGIPRVTPS